MSMTSIPTVKQWQEGTSITGRIRSQELAAIDAALRRYEAEKSLAAFNLIATRLDAWTRAKQTEKGLSPTGQEWRKNDRNAKLFVSDLYELMHPTPAKALSSDEAAARAAVEQALKNSIAAVFKDANAKVQFKVFGRPEHARITGGGDPRSLLGKAAANAKSAGRVMKPYDELKGAYGDIKGGVGVFPGVKTTVKPVGKVDAAVAPSARRRSPVRSWPGSAT